MIEPAYFADAALERGFRFYSTVPCSYFKPLLNYVTQDPRLTFVGAANEGDAVAIATGAALAGRRAIVMMQNSGLGNAVNPLTSLNAVFELPLLLVVTWRAEPGTSDEPQHRVMGIITPSLLELMEIAWDHFPSDQAQISGVLDRAVRDMENRRRPYALIMRKGSVASFKPLRTYREEPSLRRVEPEGNGSEPGPLPDRVRLLRAIVDATAGPDTLIIATTGYTGRELYAVEDRANHFYMVGSMGCALPLGLGLALSVPRKRVVVLDGDGALLMRMGAMATVGACAPANLVHILFDNEAHLSTGGQPTVSGSTDFCRVAASVGYRKVLDGNSEAMLIDALRSDPASGPVFHRVKVSARVADDLPRPRVTPAEVAARLQRHICDGH